MIFAAATTMQSRIEHAMVTLILQMMLQKRVMAKPSVNIMAITELEAILVSVPASTLSLTTPVNKSENKQSSI